MLVKFKENLIFNMSKKRNLTPNTEQLSDSQLMEQYRAHYNQFLISVKNKEYFFNNIEKLEENLYIIKQFINAINERIENN